MNQVSPVIGETIVNCKFIVMAQNINKENKVELFTNVPLLIQTFILTSCEVVINHFVTSHDIRRLKI